MSLKKCPKCNHIQQDGMVCDNCGFSWCADDDLLAL